MKNLGILVVSFGTSYAETYEKNILALESDIKNAYPIHVFFTAFSSEMVRRILNKRGVIVHNVTTALEEMYAQGIKEIIVQPTHLLMGIEYEKMCAMIDDLRFKFDKITISRPLLSNIESLLAVVDLLSTQNPVDEDTAVVLMGHGTEHFVNTVYPTMDYIAKEKGLNHLFVGTVEGYPDVETLIKMVKKTPYTKVHLLPLMLVAGDHAINDMAGEDEDSWKRQFEAQGYEVSVELKGLGEYAGIRAMYLKHLETALKTHSL